VSIVVNNAGIALNTPVLDASLADIRAELETNLFGIIRVTRAFTPILARHPSSSLVNVLSVLSWLAFGKGYEISKAVSGQTHATSPGKPQTRSPPDSSRSSPTKPPAPSSRGYRANSPASTSSSPQHEPDRPAAPACEIPSTR